MKYFEQLVKDNLSLITNAADYNDVSFFQSLCMPPVGWPNWIDKSEFEVVKSMSDSTYALNVCRVLRDRVCYSSRDNIDSNDFLAYLGTKEANSIISFISFLERERGQLATALNQEEVAAKAKNFRDSASSYVKEKFSKIDRDNDESNRPTTAADCASLPDVRLRKSENPASFFNLDKNDATSPLMPGLANKNQKTILDCCAVM